MKKLRNKKTGEVEKCEAVTIQTDVRINDYSSITEVNEEWEDYEPDEPLIEHEIVRKALRWWAVSNGITGDASLLFVGAANGFTCENLYISFDDAVYDLSEKLISGNTYDLEELCGEEEE